MVAYMLTEKARNAGISLYPSEITKLRQLATVHDNGNVAQFLRRLIGEGLSSPSAEVSTDIISRLAAHYTPAEARRLPPALKATDQPSLLSRILRELIECVADGIEPAALHVAAAHEISVQPIPLASLRYPPRAPRTRWLPEPAPTYPEPAPRDFTLNEAPRPYPKNKDGPK